MLKALYIMNEETYESLKRIIKEMDLFYKTIKNKKDIKQVDKWINEVAKSKTNLNKIKQQ